MPKCPYYLKKVSGKYYSGLKCNSIGISLTIGDDSPQNGYQGWSEDERDLYIKKFCQGDYETCRHYAHKV